jgi:hypothetical protein
MSNIFSVLFQRQAKYLALLLKLLFGFNKYSFKLP